MRAASRRWLSRSCAVAFAPIAFVCVAKASHADAPSSVALEAAPLPHGVHLGRDGRYRQDLLGDRSQRFHRFLERLLPEDWLPGRPLPFGEGAVVAAGSFDGGPMLPDGGITSDEPGMAPADLVAAYQIPAGSAARGAVVAVVDFPIRPCSQTSSHTEATSLCRRSPPAR